MFPSKLNDLVNFWAAGYLIYLLNLNLIGVYAVKENPLIKGFIAVVQIKPRTPHNSLVADRWLRQCLPRHLTQMTRKERTRPGQIFWKNTKT